MTFTGKTIAEIRPMSDEEQAMEGWERTRYDPPVVVFEDGTKIYPSQDHEGNGPGALFGVDPHPDGDELFTIGFENAAED